jgi:hypothetical protein
MSSQDLFFLRVEGYVSLGRALDYVVTSEEKLAIKERALQKLAPAGKPITRFKADDALLTFLASL